MSNKKGIAFYLDRKFIVYEEETTKVHSMLLDYNIEECFENIKNIVYSYDNNDIIIKIFSDSLIFISDKRYESEDWEKSKNRLIKLANIILAIMFSTSSEYLNMKKGSTTFFIHDKEITVKNIIHCTASNEYNEIEFIGCNGTVKLDDLKQRDDINGFERNNNTSFVYDVKTINEFFQLFEKNLNLIIDKKIENIVYMLYRSILETKKSNFDISILLSFFVIENVLSDMWDNALIERDLYKKLKDDMNYTIAIKSNMLYMNGVISKEELDKIDFARKKRNSIAHANFEFQDKFDFSKMFSISSEIFLFSIDLFAKYYNINFKMQYGFEG